MSRVRVSALVVAIALAMATGLNAQVKISGSAFGDFYYVAQNHDTVWEGYNGFWMRLMYMKFDSKLADNFSTTVRIDMASKDYTKASDKIVPYVKQAFLKWKLGMNTLQLGIMPTPTWNIVNKQWGYRSVAKTPESLYKYGVVTDFGLALKGKLADGMVSYWFMVGNGEGFKTETNKYKKLYGHIGINPIKPLYIELYGDYMKLDTATTRNVFHGYVSYRTPMFRVGALYSVLRVSDSDTTLNYPVVSVFGIVSPTKKVDLILRFDRSMEANPMAGGIAYYHLSDAAPFNLIIAGLSYKLCKKVKIIPNIVYVTYSEPEDGGEKPDSDLFAKITFHFKW